METINDRLARFVEHVGANQANGKGVPEAARKAGLDPNTLRIALRAGASKPSYDTISGVLRGYPSLNPDWLLLGKGEMLRNAQASSPAVIEEAALPEAEEPAASYAPAAPALVIPDVVNKLLDQLNTQGEYHKEQLRQAKKDFNRHLDASSRQWQYTVDRMEDQLKAARAENLELKEEVFRLKLAAGERKPTPVEIEAMEKQAAPAKRTAVKGLRSYEEEVPELVEMVAVRGESDFSRLRVLEQEECHLKAA